METFQLYHLDDNGRTYGPPRELLAIDDANALRAVFSLLGQRPMELWRDGRQIARFSPTITSPDSNWIFVLK